MPINFKLKSDMTLEPIYNSFW